MKKAILTNQVRAALPQLSTPRNLRFVTIACDEDDGTKGKKKIRVKDSSRIRRLMEKARTQERDKLQGRIDELAKKARILQRKLDKAEGSFEALKEARDSDGKTVDVEALLEKAHRKWSKRAKQNSGDDDLRTEFAQLQKKVEKYETRELRRRLIAEAGGEDTMIVELVKGDTEEEIEASIEKAQSAFEKYGGKKKKRSGDDEDEDDIEDSDEEDEDEDESEDGDEDDDESEDDDDNTSGKGKRRKSAPNARAASGRNGRSARKGDSLLKGVKSMNTTDYGKNRPKIMERLRARYNGAANPFHSRQPLASRRG